MAIGINFEQDTQDVGPLAHLSEDYDAYYNPVLEAEIAWLKREIKRLKRIIRETAKKQKTKQKK